VVRAGRTVELVEAVLSDGLFVGGRLHIGRRRVGETPREASAA